MTLQAGIAAGHPATAEAGLEILAEGGTAADATAAASLASCVAETVMTGIAGGGHLLWYEARSGKAELLDFFVAVPGLGRAPRELRLEDVGVPFGAQVVHYSIGIDSFAVPGVPAGLDELWRRAGRLPWARVVEPALRLARNGVPMPAAHASCLAMVEPVMTLGEGARIYAPGGVLLRAGDRLEQPGLVRTLEAVVEEGARTFYEGTIAEAILALMHEREGPVTREDLEAYRPVWFEPVECEYAGFAVLTRGGLAGVAETLSAFPPLRRLAPAERALTLARALEAPPYSGTPEHTTNLCVADAEGNVCVCTTSLGLGSGDFLPGYDVHLNSMLGETDLLVGRREPGRRVASMMAPTLVLDDRPAIAAGAAGGTRLRPALVQVLAGILDEGLLPQEAVSRPRLHSTGEHVHLEPGFEVGVAEALEAAGYRVRRWDALHHYFGGVSALTRSGGAADPRRSGAALSLR
ncbi:MAG: gamma-glutamyltransferase [Gaiellaceae bacterium]